MCDPPVRGLWTSLIAGCQMSLVAERSFGCLVNDESESRQRNKRKYKSGALKAFSKCFLDVALKASLLY